MTGNSTQWIVIHMVHGEETAARAEQMLRQEGFMVLVRPVSGGAGEALMEICALPSEAKEARSVLIQHGY